MRKGRGIALLVLILSLVLSVAVGGAQEKKKIGKEAGRKSETDQARSVSRPHGDRSILPPIRSNTIRSRTASRSREM